MQAVHALLQYEIIKHYLKSEKDMRNLPPDNGCHICHIQGDKACQLSTSPRPEPAPHPTPLPKKPARGGVRWPPSSTKRVPSSPISCSGTSSCRRAQEASTGRFRTTQAP